MKLVQVVISLIISRVVCLGFITSVIGGRNKKTGTYVSFDYDRISYKVESGVRWFFVPQGKSIFIGTSFIFSQEHDDRGLDGSGFELTKKYLNINFDIGYSFLIKNRLVLQPYFQIAPFPYLFVERGGDRGPAWNTRLGYESTPLIIGLKVGCRF